MRWPFRRRAEVEPPAGAATGGEPAVAGDAGGASTAGPVDAAGVVRPPARQWATLPAISTTVPLTAPLVVGPAPVVPLLRLGDRHGTAQVEVPAGTVTGLARPVVRAPEPVVQHADVPPPPLPRRAAKPVPTEVTSLVDAVDEYVGEPRQPAEPYRAPGWLRFMPDWAKAGQSPAIPGLPAPTPTPLPAPAAPELVIAEPPSFLPPELRNPPKAESPTTEPPKAELPPRMAEGIQPAAETMVPPARKRRPNLGQSRRLGLGAPISKPDLVHPEEPPPIVDGTVHTPQEPPPPSAAPARVAVEPAPEPAPEPEPAPVRVPEPTPVDEPVAIDREPREREPHGGELQGGELIHPTRGPSATEAPSIAERKDPGPGSPAPTPDRTTPDTGRRPPSGGLPTVPAKPVAATYRATGELRPAPRRKELPRATVVDRVPATLANEVRTRQQADVSDVPVYRGPKVGEAAKARGARAFAAGGAVFLPDEAGPVDSPRARGLLAHELVHAVQQRTFGVLPGADSPLGHRLEAEAQAAERFYSGEAGAAEPPPLIHAPRSAPAAAGEPDLSMAAQLATELLPTQTQTPAPQPLHSPFDAVTTAEVDKIATESAKHVVQEWTSPALQRGHGAGQGNTATHPTAGGSRPGRTGGTAGTFNAAARREELIAQTLTMRNAALAPGEGAVTELSDEDLITIDNIVASEAGQHGGTPPAGPAVQHYEPNSGKAWMHALTGMNMNYGLGLGGYSEKVGSDNSWFASETEDKRPLRERMADQLGVINEDTATQFDTDTWWQDKESTAASSTDPAAQHDESMYGRPNPDRSAVDINRIDLDELATRLYDRLRSRLRTELLIDRERAGLLTDFR